MTGASGAGSVAGSPLSKWQLALAVGAPVALGLGYMYYKSSTKPSPKPSRGKPKSTSKENGAPTDKQISIDGECPTKTSPQNTPETETPLEKAQRFKNQGNDQFKIGKYNEAIAQYNNAIEVCPKDNTETLATLYQNRAAAYEQLKKYSAVKADCTKALELKPRYAKALMRRARALDQCNDLESAVEDITAACILEGFSNQTALLMADKVLKQIGRQHAIEYMATKKYVMPSKYFIKTHIASFINDPISAILKSEDKSNISPGFMKCLNALEEQNYDDIIPLCTEEINSSKPEALPYKMEAILLRATFYLLLGQYDEALQDFEIVINDENVSTSMKVNALIKRASLFMQFEEPEKSYVDFEKAIELDPNCCDIYNHRGQLNLIMDNLKEAKSDFEKAVDLVPDNGQTYVKKCYADFRYGITKRDMELIAEATTGFEKAFEKFPDCTECYTLYAQILSETQECEKSDVYFAKAIEKDPQNATIYVHRGILQLQWNGNIDKAVEYINKALEVDDKCELAYETLATILVQRGDLKEAVKLFDKSVALGRTITQLAYVFSLRDAAKTQLTVKERLGSDIT